FERQTPPRFDQMERSLSRNQFSAEHKNKFIVAGPQFFSGLLPFWNAGREPLVIHKIRRLKNLLLGHTMRQVKFPIQRTDRHESLRPTKHPLQKASPRQRLPDGSWLEQIGFPPEHQRQSGVARRPKSLPEAVGVPTKRQ